MKSEISKFLEDLNVLNSDLCITYKKIRKLILKINPDIEEKIMYGGLVYKSSILLWGIFLRKKYITVEFGNAINFNDPYLLLEGKGKERRHIKIYDTKEIKDKHLEFYLTNTIA